MSKNLIMVLLVLSVVGVIVLGYFTCLSFFMPNLLELNTEDSKVLSNSRTSLCVATGIYFAMMVILSISYKSKKNPEKNSKKQQRNLLERKSSKYD